MELIVTVMATNNQTPGGKKHKKLQQQVPNSSAVSVAIYMGLCQCECQIVSNTMKQINSGCVPRGGGGQYLR